MLIPMSQLVLNGSNPRRVKPAKQAHHELVSLIRSHGLLHPLLVRPHEDDPKKYRVIAGARRLAALREIHGKEDVKVPCTLRKVDDPSAAALALGENFGRQPMHPLDEAEAFAKLASGEGKDAEDIAAEFGVTEHYVRQRMKLATLAAPIKAAYREGSIDTSTAEAFASVPEKKQVEVWKEVGEHPRHAEHVRNAIAHDWIDASHALFDLSVLSEGAVSRDLFSERVLVERQTFMKAQTEALNIERTKLTEEGWPEVVAGQRADVQDRLYAMDTVEPEFDKDTALKLEKLSEKRAKLEEKSDKIEQGDDTAMRALNEKFHTLEAEEREIVEHAPVHFSEETKAVATVFLVLDPDGQVHREYRAPRRRGRGMQNGNGHADGSGEELKPPTSEDLSATQLATTFTHEALAVREELIKNTGARKRILAIILHEKTRSEALSVRHEANGTTLHASMSDGFASPALDRLKEKRAKLDPFNGNHDVEDEKAYDELCKLSDSKIDALIDLLVVECITAHLQRPTDLVRRLAVELKVNIRDYWRPDAAWLGSYQKIQLAHLMIELKGKEHAPPPEQKKSELVAVLAKLFSDAAEGKLEDAKLAERVNQWRPANFRIGKKGK